MKFDSSEDNRPLTDPSAGILAERQPSPTATFPDSNRTPDLLATLGVDAEPLYKRLSCATGSVVALVEAMSSPARVDQVVALADSLRKLEREAAETQRHLDLELGPRSSTVRLNEDYALVQRTLAELWDRLRGNAALDGLVQACRLWQTRFAQFLDLLEREEQLYQRRTDALAALASIRQLLDAACFSYGYHDRLIPLLDAAQRDLTGASVEEVESRFSSELEAWQDPAGSQALCQHYALTPWTTAVEDTSGPLQQLAKLLGQVRAGAQTAAQPFENPTNQALPAVPGGTEIWWHSPPLMSLALFLEFELAAARVVDSNPAAVLQNLVQIWKACRQRPELLPCKPSGETIRPLLEQTAADDRFWGALTSAVDLLGEDDGLRLAASVLRAAARDALWRLPPTAPDGPDWLRAKPSVRTIARRKDNGLDASLRMHLLAAATDSLDEFSRLLLQLPGFPESLLDDLPAVGLWAFLGMPDAVQLNTLPKYLRKDPQTLFALTNLPSDSRLGVLALQAALELLCNHHWSSGLLPPTHSWTFVQRAAKDYPNLTARLRCLLSAEKEELWQMARVRSYGGIASLEQTCLQFVREKVSPLLRAALEPDSVDRRGELQEGARQEREVLPQYLEQLTGRAPHPPSSRQRDALFRDCDTVLTAIESFLGQPRVPPDGGTNSTSKQALRSEIERLKRIDKAGVIAADLLRKLFVVGGDPPKLDVPGDWSALADEIKWRFPRTARLWRDGILDPQQYAQQMYKDLRTPRVLDYLSELAEEGQVGLAEELLRLVPAQRALHTGDVPGVQQRLSDCREQWAATVAEELEILRHRAQVLPPEPVLDQLWDETQGTMGEGRFDLALEKLNRLEAEIERRLLENFPPPNVEELTDRAYDLLSKLKTAASQERPSLWRNIRAVVTQLEKGDLSPEKRRALDADLARIGRRLPGPTSVTESAVQPPAETDAGACPATAPARLTGSYGIVKFVRNGQYAFILPVFSEGELASERQPDVFFRRNATAGQASGELIPNSWYGRWVRFACDSSAPTAASPSAQSVEICDPATVSLLEQELEQRCGPFDRCIGVMTEWDRHRVVVTLGQGNLPVAQDVAVFPSGTLVRFELAGPAPSVIHQLTLPRPADVDAKRQRWLTALAARGTGNRGLDPHVLTEVRSEMLQRYPPTDVRAIRFAGQLHEAIRGGRVAGADLVDAVEELTQQHPELAAWWRATQVYAFLSHHGRSREDQVAFLGQLASELPQWNVRFDSTISQVYRGIMHFIEDYALAGNAPPILTLDDVLDFLKRLQEGEGNRPHFRIEVLRARLGNRLFEVSKQPDYLEQALQCVDNALALNPRLHEAQTLRQSLLAKRPATAWPIARETDSPQVSTELPQAPVRAAGFLAMLYRGFARRPAGVEDASLWFAQVHDRTTGAVRDQLVCEHARLLVQRNQDRKAEQLVHKRLVERAPDLGADRLLRTVQEIWRKSRPTYQEAVERMRAWQRAIPSQERYLVEGILAGIAFDEGNFQLAHVHAQQSDDLAPNVEAQKLLRRS